MLELLQRMVVTGLVWAASLAGAQAMCPSLPDTLATGFVEHRTAHAVCLQTELRERTDLAAERARIDAELGNLAIELQRQRMLAEQRAVLPVWP